MLPNKGYHTSVRMSSHFSGVWKTEDSDNLLKIIQKILEIKSDQTGCSPAQTNVILSDTFLKS